MSQEERHIYVQKLKAAIVQRLRNTTLNDQPINLDNTDEVIVAAYEAGRFDGMLGAVSKRKEPKE
jgi:hypothetical protein